MKYTFLILLVIFLGCKKDNFETNQPEIVVNRALPGYAHPDHLIFVWLENHGYNSIIGNTNAPYINSLRAKGTLFTNMHALTHPSYPNYIDFFAGQNNGVTSSVCFSNVPLSTPNLYSELKKSGKTFAWYSEGLPYTGSRICSYGYYTVHHNPTTIFTNVPTSANKTWTQFPTDFSKLENVVCISPNKLHDMHDGTILQGDTWVKTYLSKLAEWCRTHNSVFVVYFDEDGKTENNRIPAIAVGQYVKANYKSGTYIDHYNWTHTICSMFYAANKWTPNLSTRLNISDCWN